MFIDGTLVSSIGRQLIGPNGAIRNIGASTKPLHACQQFVVQFVICCDIAENIRRLRFGKG
jgi:hypothetical protein